MRNRRKRSGDDAVRVELKYCEHCGSLWLREAGAEMAYCEQCRPKVADLPPAKKKPGRLLLPVRKPSMLPDSFEYEMEDGDEMEFDASGGVA